MKTEGQRVTAECVRYWKRTGVPRSALAEMRHELEQHLRDALGEGKTARQVVGPDVALFAETWAGEFRRPRPAEPVSHALIPSALALAAAVVAFYQAWDLWTQRGVLLPEGTPFRTMDLVPEAQRWFWSLLVGGALALAAAAFLARGRVLVASVLLLAVAPVGILAVDVYAWAISVLALTSFFWSHLRLRWTKRQAVGRIPKSPLSVSDRGTT